MYLAAPYPWKAELAIKAQELRDLGVTITSTWMDKVASDTNAYESVAAKDISEVEAADAVVLFTLKGAFEHGGRMHEFGYAHGRGKALIVCGPRENIFHYLESVLVLSNWEEVKSFFERKRASK